MLIAASPLVARGRRRPPQRRGAGRAADALHARARAARSRRSPRTAPLLAWFAPGTRAPATPSTCSRSRTAAGSGCPTRRRRRTNVTCRWDVAPPGEPRARRLATSLWTLRESRRRCSSTTSLGAGSPTRSERRFQESPTRGAARALARRASHGRRDQHARLRHRVGRVRRRDRAASSGRHRATMKIAGGGVYRVVGRKPPKLIPSTEPRGRRRRRPARQSRTSRRRGRDEDGAPVAAADLPIEVVDAATGAVDRASVSRQGTPLAIALAPHVLVELERTPLGPALAWYYRDDRRQRGGLRRRAAERRAGAERERPVRRLPRSAASSTCSSYATRHSRTLARDGCALRRRVARRQPPRVGRERQGPRSASARSTHRTRLALGSDGLELFDLDAGREPPRLARVEPARAELEHRRRRAADAARSASSSGRR